MNNMIELAKQQVKETLMNALGRLVAEGKIEAVPLPAFNVERPADVSHGDFSCNAAMASAKALRNNPRAIGQMIADAAVLDGTVFEKIEVAGPGFLNFFISPLWFNETVGEVISSGSDYARARECLLNSYRQTPQALCTSVTQEAAHSATAYLPYFSLQAMR